ncbi:MAG: iron ABC transporter permease [Gammaproteobacteria bacterium]|nr:iron ABC transporter permease [Gammaproteobacteria bacterium]
MLDRLKPLRALSLARLGSDQGWFLSVFIIAALIILPLLIVLQFNLHARSDTWQHLIDYLLWDYVKNSILLGLGVAFGTFIIGVPAACICALYRFPGKGLIELLLLLPLSMPAYIIAYTYTGMLEVGGPVQQLLRDSFDLSYGEYWFPEIRSLEGAIVMFSFVLYPYVFLLTRSSLLNQSANIVDAARLLGASRWQCYSSVILPLARPSIAAGVILVLMETLADYGTVQYFGISTFTTGIFRTWFGYGEAVTAAQLSSLLMAAVFMLFLVEKYLRGRIRFNGNTSAERSRKVLTLHGKAAAAAISLCLIPAIFGFIIPLLQLISWAIETADEMLDAHFWQLTWNSLLLAISAAALTLVIATILAYARRISKSTLLKSMINLCAMGYAVPGTVIAVGAIILLSSVDNWLIDTLREQFSIESGLLLTGTIFALVFAHTVRFLSLALQTVDASLSKISHSIDEASRLLGNSIGQTLRRIHVPLIGGGLLSAALLVFVEVMKELPATLIMRPFNFNTLAVRAYELASDERLADASTAALAIVMTGIIPVILLNISIRKK